MTRLAASTRYALFLVLITGRLPFLRSSDGTGQEDEYALGFLIGAQAMGAAERKAQDLASTAAKVLNDCPGLTEARARLTHKLQPGQRIECDMYGKPAVVNVGEAPGDDREADAAFIENFSRSGAEGAEDLAVVTEMFRIWPR